MEVPVTPNPCFLEPSLPQLIIRKVKGCNAIKSCIRRIRRDFCGRCGPDGKTRLNLRESSFIWLKSYLYMICPRREYHGDLIVLLQVTVTQKYNNKYRYMSILIIDEVFDVIIRLSLFLVNSKTYWMWSRKIFKAKIYSSLFKNDHSWRGILCTLLKRILHNSKAVWAFLSLLLNSNCAAGKIKWYSFIIMF